MKLIIFLVAVLIASTSYADEELVGDPVIGSYKSVGCKGCHGDDGVAEQRMHPSLAGQNPGYIVWQLKVFRNGERKSHIMNHIAGSLTDQDIVDLAAYYSQLTACVSGEKQ